MPVSSKMSRSIEEQMRRVSSRSTEQIARHFGGHFPIWVGCGFPKSGTVWLCKLMSSYLGVPYPQNYALPVAMKSVVHAHWRYDERLPKTVYIYRDGRDVMVSLYFHQMKSMADDRHPRSAQKLRRRYADLLGPSHDLTDVRANLPRFMEAEFERPAFMKDTWPQHIHDWMGTPRPNVFPVKYEDLKLDTATAFADVMTRMEGAPADERRIQYAVARNDFALVSGREPGSEDQTAELRKGIVGDWRNHFTREAAEVFERYAGKELLLLGYETSADWVSTV